MSLHNPLIEPTDDLFMQEALRLAKKAYAADEVPVGAIVVREGKIIAGKNHGLSLDAFVVIADDPICMVLLCQRCNCLSAFSYVCLRTDLILIY